MVKKGSFVFVFAMIAMLIVVLFAGAAAAHTPLFSCWDNGDGTLSCEGGFSDGSSAAGIEVRVVDDKGAVIYSGKLDEFGELTFNKPKGAYSVVFDSGPGHSITVKGSDIK